MDITWYGHSCFRIAERGAPSVITDPFDESIGYGKLALKSEVVTMSHDKPGHAALENVKEWQIAINRPGEYEVGGIFIIGTPMINKKEANPRYNVVYSFDYGSLNVVHLGDLDHVPSSSALEVLGTVSILMIPVGGGGGLSSNQAAEVVAMLEPNLVIPMHYQTPHALLDLAPVDKFLAEMGVTTPVEAEVLKVSASSLPEQTQVALLSYKIG